MYTSIKDDGSIMVTTEIASVNKILVMPGAAIYPAIAELAAREAEDADKLHDIDAEGMTFRTYQRAARRTQSKDLSDAERLDHARSGLAAEVGEIHSIFQKAYQGHEINDESLAAELGDLLWFVAEFADARGWSLGTVAGLNIRKLRRRYPAGFDAERSLHREGEHD